MSEVFFAALSPMLFLFICIVIGFSLNKMKLLPPDAALVMSRLENYVFMPAMGFSAFMKFCTVDSIRENSGIFAYSILAIAFAMGIAVPLSGVFEKKDADKRNIYKYGLTFANFGFMGNAIIPLILGGQEHLYRYLLFTLLMNFTAFVWGIPILTPKEHRKGSAIKNVANPPMLGFLAGAVAGLTGIAKCLPEFVITTADGIQNCMGPVAMILTGFVIGDYSFKSLVGNKKVYIVTFLRLFVLPLIILAVLYLFGASKYVMTLAFFAYATPFGLNMIVFPAAFGGDTKPGAGMAMISHTLSVLTMPLLYSLLMLIMR